MTAATLYRPFAALLRRAGADVLEGTTTYDEQTTAFLRGDGPRPGLSPQNFGIGARCERAKAIPGLRVEGPVVALDLASRDLTLPMVRVVFERRGRTDMLAGLAEVFAYLDRRAPW